MHFYWNLSEVFSILFFDLKVKIKLFQAMNDSRASQVRFMKYLLPVLALSVLFNLPKFFEAEIKYDYESNETSSNANKTSYYDIPTIDVTALRKDPDYAIYYHNWARLAVLGIVPFVMLVYFNTKIYNDLQVNKTSDSS